MGLSGISAWQLLVVLLIVVVIFGTKKLGSLGSDLGGAVKGFRKAMSSDEEDTPGLTQKESDDASLKQSADDKDKTA